ncbi:MAG TPA: hypothetical protein VLH12_08575 [Usitatibacter sp.]|nr:hypothetical protein [Usitatibacter sp.]
MSPAALLLVASIPAVAPAQDREIDVLLRLHERDYSIIENRVGRLEHYQAEMQAKSGSLLTFDQHQAQILTIEKRLDDIEKYEANLDGKLFAIGTAWTLIVVIANVVISFLKNRTRA